MKLHKILTLNNKSLRNERGVAALEYAMILGLVCLVASSALAFLVTRQQNYNGGLYVYGTPPCSPNCPPEDMASAARNFTNTFVPQGSNNNNNEEPTNPVVIVINPSVS